MFRDRRTAQAIIQDMAVWTAVTRSSHGGSLAAKIADEMLYSAAVIYFSRQTERMGSGAGAAWVRRRVEDMLTEVTNAGLPDGKP